MTLRSADFESGSNGNPVSTGDAGSADAWDLVTITSPGTLAYDNAHTVGAMAAKLVASTASAGIFASWIAAFGTQTDHYGRVYLYFTANPTDSAHAMIVEALTGATICGGWNVSSTGKLQVVSGTATVVKTSTTSIALNQWIRVEYHFIHSATVGQIELKLFNTASSTTPDETITATASMNTQASADRIRFGLAGASPSGYGTFWMDDIVAAATSYPGPAAAGNPPVDTVAPVASGTATVGQTVSTTNGTWTGDATITFGYQWQRDSHGNSVYSNIGGATSSSYTLVDADDGCNVRCVVTGTNGAGSASANSNALGTVIEPAPTNSVAPAVTGTATVGQVLTTDNGTWAHMGGFSPTFTYQWQRAGVNIGGATSGTYTLVDADDALAIRCVVTAHNTNASSASANSNATAAVVEPVPTNSAAPLVSGSAPQGSTLSCSTGTWTHQGGTIATYAYQWTRDGVNIAGATASTYTTLSADHGTAVGCKVTATNTGGSSTATASSNTVTVTDPVTSGASYRVLARRRH